MVDSCFRGTVFSFVMETALANVEDARRFNNLVKTEGEKESFKYFPIVLGAISEPSQFDVSTTDHGL